jgi:hypothetical protein
VDIFPKSLWGEREKTRAKKKHLKIASGPYPPARSRFGEGRSEYSVRRVRSDQRAGPERMLAVSRKIRYPGVSPRGKAW